MLASARPPLVLAALGAASGFLGMFALGFGYGEAPHPGLHMVLTGVWFGLVIGFGVWRWGNRSWGAVAIAAGATWIAWEAAVNLALLLDQHWLQATPLPPRLRTHVTGLAAGAVGASLTWAGAAYGIVALRTGRAAMRVAATGAVFGLLLVATHNYDSPLVLLVPWQAAVAAALGMALGRQTAEPGRMKSALSAAR
jgi:hypothetical protein